MFDRTAAVSIAGITLQAAGNSQKDMEKIAAIRERHFINAISMQLSSRYGLSEKSSLRLAKVTHQWNRLAGSRELTDKDAEAFSTKMIGSSIKDVQAALKKSVDGDNTDLKLKIDVAAETLGASPEQINKILMSVLF